MTIEHKLQERGLVLPEASKAIATYVPYVKSGSLVFISGQLPMANGNVVHKGKVGDSQTLEQGQEAARLCAINILVQLKTAVEGDWSRVEKCVRIGGFVNSTPDYEDHPQVINGASDFLVDILGEEIGRHARAAVGVSSLPRGASVEVEALFSIRP